MSETKVIINYEEIVKAIGNQFVDVWNALIKSQDEGVKNLISNITSIEVSDEQSFVSKRRKQTLLQGTLYVAVRFGSGAINYANSVTPISLYCVGTANKVKPAQLILGIFASTWTTKNLAQELVGTNDEDLEIHDALQVWNTPEIITNFNEIDSDFKNLFRLTGNIVVGPKAIRLGKMTYYFDTKEEQTSEIHVSADYHDVEGYSYYKEVEIENVDQKYWNTVEVGEVTYSSDFESVIVTFDSSRGVFVIQGTTVNEGYVDGSIDINFSYIAIMENKGSETVNLMSYQDGYQAKLDPQPFGNTNGFAKSEVDFSTLAFTVTTYLVNGQLGKDMLAVRGFRFRPGGIYSEETSKFYANKRVKIKIEFTNGYTNMPGENEVCDNGDLVKGDDFYCYFKVAGSQIGIELGRIPSLIISFAR